MQIQAKSQQILSSQSEVLIVGLNADLEISETLKQLDTASNGFFDLHSKANNLPQKAGEIRTFYAVEGLSAKAIVVVAYEDTQKGFISAHKKVTAYLRQYKITQADSTLHLNSCANLSLEKKSRLASQSLLDADYVCDTYKSNQSIRSAIKINLLVEQKDKVAEVESGINSGVAIANGMNALKDLGNAPGNVCTPKYLAKHAKKLAETYPSLKVSVLKEKAIKDLKMGALLSVSKGSIEPPRLITLEYNGAKGEPIVLVGKGVTFDTGGISLKPGAGMDEMKYDMCGAGSVLGTMQAIAMMKLPVNVVGVVAAVENMPSDRATKPGDIVTSMSGKTIEVLNTDAEGRMILCDALTYAKRFNPKAIIDIATLTGAVIIALGKVPCGLMSNNDVLAEALLQAGQASGDRAWRLPIWEEYVEQLKSPFADLQNIGGREAGSITAGCFLGEFTKDMNWAHLDVAGTAWRGGKHKGATGRPVPLLVEYLMSQV